MLTCKHGVGGSGIELRVSSGVPAEALVPCLIPFVTPFFLTVACLIVLKGSSETQIRCPPCCFLPRSERCCAKSFKPV